MVAISTQRFNDCNDSRCLLVARESGGKYSSKSEKFLGENLDASKNAGNSQESTGENSIQKNSPRNINDSQELAEDKSDQNSSTKKNRRRYGDGSGYIYIRAVTKKGKQYQEAYYHYEFWDKGNRLVKTSKYIPKKLLGEVKALEIEKVPVQDILALLGET
jgi:hypothetical protein